MVIIDNLVKNYGDFRLNISMDIPDGTVTGIIGKNGAGKTTIIKALLGLIKPDGGHVTVNGKETSKLTGADKAGFGVALSESGFCPYLNAKDVMHILKKMYPTFDEDFFRSSCVSQGLALDKKIKDYSTGMRAKLRVLTAISHKADILIMDEPTAALGARQQALVYQTMRMAANKNLGVLVISHDIPKMLEVSDKICIMRQGKVIANLESKNTDLQTVLSLMLTGQA